MIVALPALFLAVWLLLLPLPRFQGYRDWRTPYASLLALAIACEMLAFFWPLWSFHREMAKQKHVLLREAHYSPHSFRATGITNFLENDGTLEAAQRIAGHADSRTTKLYDRRGQKVLLEDMERIRY
jgi:integrase